MVKSDVAAIRHDAVDELDLARLKRQCAIALIQCFQVCGREASAIILSKILSSWTAITPSRHPVQPKYFE